MRTMYDAVDWSAIPASAKMVAGYLDGPVSQWPPQGWQRFPDAVKVGIVVFASADDGHVLDVERWDATPDQAPGWAARRRASGADPTIYCSLSTWAAVKAAFAAAGIAEPHYWIADWDGVAELPPGAVAVQYAADADFDISVAADYWPGVDNGQSIQPVPPASALGQPPVAVSAPDPAETVPEAMAALQAAVAALQRAIAAA